MADFNTAVALTLKEEGGWSDNPTDPGGATNMGITFRTFQQYSWDVLQVEPTLENLKALTVHQAELLYYRIAWIPIQGDEIPSQALANNVFDFYVNAGVHSTKLLQSVLNGLGASPQIVVDGRVGLSTLNALQAANADAVTNAFGQGRIDYYNALASTYPQFVKGWLARAERFWRPS